MTKKGELSCVKKPLAGRECCRLGRSVGNHPIAIAIANNPAVT